MRFVFATYGGGNGAEEVNDAGVGCRAVSVSRSDQEFEGSVKDRTRERERYDRILKMLKYYLEGGVLP